MSLQDTSQSQATALAGTGEATIITADPNFRNALAQLTITTANAAAGTLTLRDGTGGATVEVFNYPDAASAPQAPLVVPFNPPLNAGAKNTNWTLQASVNASGYNVTALFVKQP